jgi:hypothetical protein
VLGEVVSGCRNAPDELWMVFGCFRDSFSPWDCYFVVCRHVLKAVFIYKYNIVIILLLAGNLGLLFQRLF